MLPAISRCAIDTRIPNVAISDTYMQHIHIHGVYREMTRVDFSRSKGHFAHYAVIHNWCARVNNIFAALTDRNSCIPSQALPAPTSLKSHPADGATMKCTLRRVKRARSHRARECLLQNNSRIRPFLELAGHAAQMSTVLIAVWRMDHLGLRPKCANERDGTLWHLFNQNAFIVRKYFFKIMRIKQHAYTYKLQICPGIT